MGVAFRVLMGPVSLGPLNAELRSALREQLPGLELQFDEAALQWSRDEGRINLVVFGTRLYDDKNRVIAQAPEAEIGLAAGRFVLGDVVIRRITLVGVQLTLVHTVDGSLRLGVEHGGNQSDILKQIRDAIERNATKGGPSLKSFAVRRARLAFYDEATGAFVVAPEADLQVTETASGRGQSLVAEIDAQLEISGSPAHLLATVQIPRAGDTLAGDYSLNGLSLQALARNTNTFAFLRPFALKTDVSGSFALLDGTKLSYAEFGFAASGVLGGLGRPLRLKSVRVAGRYDGRSGQLLIDDGDVQSERLRAHFAGSSDLSFASDGSVSAAKFALTLDRLSANMPDVLSADLSHVACSLSGVYLTPTRQFIIDQAVISGGPLSASFAGKVTLNPGTSPAVMIDGKVNAMDVRDLVRYWPQVAASGARSWIDANFANGHLGPFMVHTSFAPGAMDRPVLPEDALAVSFPVSGATITYIRGLRPLTNVEGTAKLTGDTFHAQVDSASVGHLAVTQGNVTIPDLHMHAMIGDIRAHVEGGLSEALALIDMKPLQYARRFHINSNSASGSGEIDLHFLVPMIRSVSVNQIGIGVNAAVTGLALSLGPHTKITDGRADFDIDNSTLRATGRIALGTANLDIGWLETFADAPVTTHLSVRGVFDDRARSEINLPTGHIVTGPVPIDAELEGHRGVLQHATMTADLTPASLAVDIVNIDKPPGSPGTARVSADLDADGNIHSADLTILAGSLTAQGSATFGPEDGIQHLSLISVRDGKANDFALALTESPAGGLDVTVTGHSVDGTSLIAKKSKPAEAAKEKTSGPPEPFHLSAKLDQLALHDGIDLAPVTLDASGLGSHFKTLSLHAMLSKTSPVTADIAGAASGRKLSVSSADAGSLLKGLFGFSILKGGQLNLSASMPAIGAPPQKDVPDYKGELEIRDCTLVNQAFLTRLFSSGSLMGFLDLMRGQGIAVDTLLIPFAANGDVIDIHDARVSGPSIGVTTDGYFDRANNQVALQGAIAPLYGINGVLGAIPVLGNIFVSKKGEGIFGVTYRATGNADEPQVTVNPLAMLTPGIFRRIFETGAPSAPPSQASTTPPPKSQ
jgi:hypothetical protein